MPNTTRKKRPAPQKRAVTMRRSGLMAIRCRQSASVAEINCDLFEGKEIIGRNWLG